MNVFRLLIAIGAAAAVSLVRADSVITRIGDYYCWGLGYVGGRANDSFRIIYQHLIGPHQFPIVIYSSKYVPGIGYTEHEKPVFASMPDSMHPFFAYWGSRYWVGWVDHLQNYTAIVDAPTFEDFARIDADASKYLLTSYSEHNNPVPSAYSFDNDKGWYLFEGRYADGYAITYRQWEPHTGFQAKERIAATLSSQLLGVPTVLTLGRLWWRVYYIQDFGVPTYARVVFVETRDGGESWSTPRATQGLSTHYYYSRLALGRYGDNLVLFLVDPWGKCVAHQSTDGVVWGPPIPIFTDSTYYMHHGALVGQRLLLSTMSDTRYFDGWQSGIGDQYAAETPIAALTALPETPTKPVPADGSRLRIGTVDLSVGVSGPQSYDVSFYWANGRYIGTMKNLRHGDRASVHVQGLRPGSYRWYAVSRGATGAYWGEPPAETSDQRRSAELEFTVKL